MMGKYTVAGSPQFDDWVDADLNQIVQAIRKLPERGDLLELVLIGGYGRGEGTPFTTAEVPYNDYDLVVVSKPLWPWHHRRLQTQLHQLGESLAEKIGIAVDLHLHTTDTLKACEPSLLNSEMQQGHYHVWGPRSHTLDNMPAFNLEAPQLSEGTRLLMNRGKLLVHVGERLQATPILSPSDQAICQKYLYKNALAFGDCLLIAHHGYSLSYREKSERILHYCHAKVPQIARLIEGYRSACQFKLYGDPKELPQGDLRKAYQTLSDLYPQFLLWYESKRLGTPLTSLAHYCAALPKQRLSHRSLAKALALNLLLFGRHLFSPAAAWAWTHPRERLLPAICLLLQKSPDLHFLGHLMGCSPDLPQILTRFHALSMRLA